MVGICGGQYAQDCCWWSRQRHSYAIHELLPDECEARYREVFEYRCNSCGNYELSHRLTEDLEGDCSYSWPGIGFPLAEVDNMSAVQG